MKWGVTGFGVIARTRFVPGLKAVPGSKLVALQNRSTEQATTYATQFHCRGYGTVEELLRDPAVEAVYIASPPNRHLGEVEMATAAGKHILLEKPMALTIAECRDMDEMARRAGVTLMLANMLRLNAVHQEARRLIQSGALGKVVAARLNFGFLLPEFAQTWRLQVAIGGGGPLMDVGVHAVNLLRYVLNAEVDLVQGASQDWALSRPKGGDAEDTAAMTLTLTGGTLATVLVSFATPGMDNRLEVYGTEGMLWTDGSIGQESTGRLFLRKGEGEAHDATPAEIPEIYAAEIFHLEECARTGRQPLVDATDGARDLAVVLAAAQSAAEGRAVKPEAVVR